MSRAVVYTKGVFIVVENTLSDFSRVYDIHVATQDTPASVEIFQALSQEDAIARVDALAEAVDEKLHDKRRLVQAAEQAVAEGIDAMLAEYRHRIGELEDALRTAISLQHLPQGREALEHARALLEVRS